MGVLTAADIRRLRLRNQWLAPRPDVSALSVVEHMGALQAQELWSGEWSIATRSTAVDLDAVRAATAHAEILRTWPMRGTIHFVPARDAAWMVNLGATTAFTGVERRRDFLGLSETDALGAIDVLGDALARGVPVTRSDCIDILTEAGVMRDRAHAYHLLWFVAQHGVTAMGPQDGKEQTFVRLDRWVGDPCELSRDDALAELAVRYFDSHGPADRKEFARWTALGAPDVRRAIEVADERLRPVATEFGEMLLSAAVAETLGGAAVVDPPERTRAVLLLGGFDEYVLGYGDRSTMMTKEQMKLVIPGGNGIFRPTVVDDGVVIGTWKRAVKKARVEVTVSPFGDLNARQRKGVERAAAEHGAFLGLDAQVVIST